MSDESVFENTRTVEDVLISNWAVYTCTTFKLKNSALITGANESGKSTIIDALTYAMFGITDFNIQAGAGDDERSVYAYVKGDTKDNEDRFLRGDGDVTSYIAVDVHNPKDDSYLTEGVCIELYKDDTRPRSKWFVVPGAKVSDINFYTKNGNEVSFTARQDLRYKGKALTFYKRDEGIATFLRMSGLRLAQGGVRELRGKIKRLLACGKKKMDIDRFVRESIFEEDDSAQKSLENILTHKSEYEQLIADLAKLNDEKNLLTDIEKYYLEFIGLEADYFRRDIVQKKYFYMRQKEADDRAAAEEKDLESRIKVIEKNEQKAEKRFENADSEYSNAAIALREGQRPLEEMREKLRRDEESRDAMKEQVKTLKELGKRARDIFSVREDSGISDAAWQILSQAGDADTDQDALIKALSETERARIDLCDDLDQSKADAGYELRDMKKTLSSLDSEISTLKQNRKVLPDGMEKELQTLKDEAAKAGIRTEIKLVCDLVYEADAKWQAAAETFLGGRRFDIIADPEAVPGLLKIVDEKNLYHIYIVLTNRMDDVPARAPEGSLASKLKIENIYARKFINYACGSLKCVETRQELNDNPKGAIMPNGMIARGIVASKMRLVKDLVFGKDAIERQLSRRIRERERAEADMKVISERLSSYRKAYDKANKASFAPENYDVTAPAMLIRLSDDIAKEKKDITAMQNNPSAKKLMDMYLAADQKRKQAQAELNDITAEKKSLARICEDKKKSVESGRLSENTLRDEWQTALTLHPEETEAADKLYERQKNNEPASIQNAISSVKTKMSTADYSMHEAMFKYNASHAGYVADRSGAKKYIDRLNELRTRDIDETKNKIEAKAQTISDTFMRDFVEVIYARIRDMRDQRDAINAMLKNHRFGDKKYSLLMRQKNSTEMKSFFTIADKIDELGSAANLDVYLNMNSNFMAEQGFADAFENFRDTVLNEEDVSLYTDYRNYYTYDFFIDDGKHTAYLSKSQGIYSGGGKQTPYFILLTAALMTSYGNDSCCLRIAFIDEAFAAMDDDRIRSMIDYFNDNGLQVIYAAPDKTMHNIAPYVDTTCTVVKKDRRADVIDMRMDFD